MDATTALAIYRAEKDKALRERRVSHVQLMAEAQEAFKKMLADAQLARKGGRPKGSTNAASAPPPVAAVPAAVPTGKLVLKTSKPAPAKPVEKVTASAATSATAKPQAKKAASPNVAKEPKRASESRRPAAKAKPAAKAPKRAAAPAARKGSAKKPAAPRKQAASRERNAKAHRR